MIKNIGIFLSLWFACLAHAEEVFPPGCVPLVIKGERILIPAEQPRLVMIHNLSTTDLWITHPVSDPNTSAGWSSRLQTGYWSALALNDKAFELSCVESRPGHEQLVACSAVVGVCQWPIQSRPEKPSGIFWAGENMELSPLAAYVGRRGFVIPAATK